MKKVLLYIFTLIIGSFVIACNDESGVDDQSKSEQTVVRIMAAIDTSNEKPDTRSNITRAGEVIDDSNSDYTEGIEDGNNKENSVGVIRLIAFDISTGQTINNILFRAPGSDISEGEKNFEFANGIMTNIQLDMKILAGSYRFVLVTNEETAWNLAGVSSYSQLLTSNGSITNQIVSVADLDAKVTAGLGIPMIGEAYIEVKSNQNATELNPQLVTPKIQLKRTIAKVEVNIKNTDESGNVFDTAKAFKIKKVMLKNANRVYNLFEANDDIITESSPETGANVVHTEGAKIDENILTNYIAERKSVGETSATIAEITVERGGEEYVYPIPLFQYGADGKIKDYNIYRNTIYRLGTVLKGKQLDVKIDVYTEVKGWETYTIGVLELPPIDYLNLDTKTIYLGTDLSGTHTENIYYSSNLDYMEFEAGDITGLNVQNHSEFLEITIPKNNFTAGDSKPLKLIYGKGGKRVLNVTIMVKAIMNP